MRVGLMTALLSCSACVPVLVPVSAPRAGTQATAQTMGVHLWVDGAAWRGDPRELGRYATPVKVVVENHSGRELRVGYDDFTLVGSDGFGYRPLAPLPGLEPSSQRETPTVLLVDARLPSPPPPPHPAVPPRMHPARPLPPPKNPPVRFYVAPHYRYWWPHPWVWVRPFPHTWTAPAWSQSLPTDDMIAEALPEGVLQDGGRVEGFLYFRGVVARESRVTLRFELTDAGDDKPFGAVNVPLVVRWP